MVDFTEKKEERFKYLETLYKMIGGSPLKKAHHEKVVVQAGLTKASGKVAFNYLLNEGLIQAQYLAGMVNITHQGVKAYEAAVESSKVQSTSYLDTSGGATINNILHVGEISESLISFGEQTSTQDICSSATLEEVADFMEDLKSGLPDLTLEQETESLVLSEIDTIEKQLKSQQPKKTRITAAFESLKRALNNSIFETGIRFLLSKLRG